MRRGKPEGVTYGRAQVVQFPAPVRAAMTYTGRFLFTLVQVNTTWVDIVSLQDHRSQYPA
jgi:hypothetical protein